MEAITAAVGNICKAAKGHPRGPSRLVYTGYSPVFKTSTSFAVRSGGSGY